MFKKIIAKVQYLYYESSFGRNFNFYLDKYSSLALSDSAATMSYYMLFALVPLLVLIFGVLAYLSKVFYFFSISFDLKAFFPEAIIEYLLPIIKKLLKNTNNHILSLGVISLLWASSRGFDYFWGKLQEIYDVKSSSYLVRRFLGIIFIILLAAAISIFLLFISFGGLILALIENFAPLLFADLIPYNFVRFIVPFIFILLLIAVIYQVAGRSKFKFRTSLLAALVPASFWALSSLGLSWYISSFSKFDLLYGSISSIIVLAFWLYLLFYSSFLGAFLHNQIFSGEANL